MKTKRRYITYLFGTLIIMLLCLIVISSINYANSMETLVIWGKEADKCSVTTYVPILKIQTHMEGAPDCLYQVVQVNGSRVLLKVNSNSGKLTIYKIDVFGNLSVQEEIDSNVKITSELKASQNGDIYFSGISNNQEEIYRLNLKSKMIAQVTHTSDGMATLPIPSPDGKMVAYMTDSRYANRYEASSFEYSPLNQQALVEDLLDGQVINLKDYSDYQEYTPCDMVWSPSSEYLAYLSSCSPDREPTQIIVVHVASSQIVEKLNAESTNFPYVGILDWLSDDKLVYRMASDFPPQAIENQNTFFQYRYFIYDMKDRSKTELPFLSMLQLPFSQLGIRDPGITWDRFGNFAALLVDNSKDPPGYLLALGMLDVFTVRQVDFYPLDRSNSFQPRLLIPPEWSYSGKWIAYSDSSNIGIVNPDAETNIKLVDLTNYSTIQYGWLGNQ